MDMTVLSATVAFLSFSYSIYSSINGARIYVFFSLTCKNTSLTNCNPINIKKKLKDGQIGGSTCHSHQSPLAEISPGTSSNCNPCFLEQHHFYILEWASEMQKNIFLVRYVLSFIREGDKINPQPSCQRGVGGAVFPLLGNDPYNWTG